VKAFFHRPQSVSFRRALFQIHLWVGVSVGLYIFVVCVTGAALVFRIDMQRALHPSLFTPSASGPLADPSAILDSVRDAYPAGRVSGIDAPTTARPTYLAYVLSGDDFLTILVDPVTARVLGELPEHSFVRTVQDLHFDLLAGRTGRLVNGAGAALLLVMCVTGLVIWWQGAANWRRGLTLHARRSWTRVNWDLHSAIGFWTVAVIAMWAVTGVCFAFPSQFRATVNWFSPVSVSTPPLSTAVAVGTAPPSWRSLIEHARILVPDQHVARVVVPSSDRDAFLVMFHHESPTPLGTALTPVYLDRFTGAQLHEPTSGPRTAGDIVMDWVAPLHVGSFGGLPIQIAWLALGLSPPLLFITGFIMWWTRVVRPQRTRAGAADNTRRMAVLP